MSIRFPLSLLAIVCGLLFLSVAWAQTDASNPGPDAERHSESAAAEGGEVDGSAQANSQTFAETARQIFSAAKSGRWLVALGAMIMLIVSVARRFARKWIPWFGTKKGGYCLAFGVATLAVIGDSLMGSGFSIDMIAAAFTAGFSAIGMHQTVKDGKQSMQAKGDTPAG